jgi:hypothetical protein
MIKKDLRSRIVGNNWKLDLGTKAGEARLRDGPPTHIHITRQCDVDFQVFPATRRLIDYEAGISSYWHHSAWAIGLGKTSLGESGSPLDPPPICNFLVPAKRFNGRTRLFSARGPRFQLGGPAYTGWWIGWIGVFGHHRDKVPPRPRRCGHHYSY